MNIDNEINSILNKANSLRGYSVDELTKFLQLKTNKMQSSNLLHTKGFTGQLVELLLGATAKSKPLPDFPELGLEIKTLPINIKGFPLETTYVCTAPLLPKIKINKNNELTSGHFDFETSVVYKKLKKVLWMPIIVIDKQDDTATQSNRVIGSSFIWEPSIKELDLIKTDWLELTEMLYMGELDRLTSHYGEVLQIRPKAANSSVTTKAIGPDGEITYSLPRGYYLRTCFTSKIASVSLSANTITP